MSCKHGSKIFKPGKIVYFCVADHKTILYTVYEKPILLYAARIVCTSISIRLKEQ